jgi:hypothetical protein
VVAGDGGVGPGRLEEGPAGQERPHGGQEGGRLVLVAVVAGVVQVDQPAARRGTEVGQAGGPGQVVAGALDDQGRGVEAGQRRAGVVPGAGGRLGELVGVEAEPVQGRPGVGVAAVGAGPAGVVDAVVAGVHPGVAGEGVGGPRVELQQGPGQQHPGAGQQPVGADAPADGLEVGDLAGDVVAARVGQPRRPAGADLVVDPDVEAVVGWPAEVGGVAGQAGPPPLPGRPPPGGQGDPGGEEHGGQQPHPSSNSPPGPCPLSRRGPARGRRRPAARSGRRRGGARPPRCGAARRGPGRCRGP